MSTYIIHQYAPSPNCEKLRRVLTRLGIAYETVDYMPTSEEERAKVSALAERSGYNQMPVLERDGEYFGDSNLITQMLIEENPDKATLLFPADPERAAAVQAFELAAEHWWMRPEQNYLTDAYKEQKGADHAATINQKSLDRRENIIARLNAALDGRDWLVGDAYSKADISIVSHINARVFIPTLIKMLGENSPFSSELWPEWDIDADRYPHVAAWRERCSQPEFTENPVAV